jgi:hypothetical protein
MIFAGMIPRIPPPSIAKILTLSGGPQRHREAGAGLGGIAAFFRRESL